MDVFKNRPKDFKFRRQHPTGNYILDFYCHALRLAIEADGSVHKFEEIAKAGIGRQKNLETKGIKFIRVTNKEIMMNPEEVIEKINLVIDECQRKKQ